MTPVLEATRRLFADDTILYRCVYTIFRALPARLLEGSALNVSTYDVEGGVELVWEGRERLRAGEVSERDLRALLVGGPHGDLLEIALVALEQFCNLRAGFVEIKRDAVLAGTSFDRPAYATRRVLARIPVEPGPLSGAAAPSAMERDPTRDDQERLPSNDPQRTEETSPGRRHRSHRFASA